MYICTCCISMLHPSAHARVERTRTRPDANADADAVACVAPRYANPQSDSYRAVSVPRRRVTRCFPAHPRMYRDLAKSKDAGVLQGWFGNGPALAAENASALPAARPPNRPDPQASRPGPDTFQQPAASGPFKERKGNQTTCTGTPATRAVPPGPKTRVILKGESSK